MRDFWKSIGKLLNTILVFLYKPSKFFLKIIQIILIVFAVVMLLDLIFAMLLDLLSDYEAWENVYNTFMKPGVLIENGRYGIPIYVGGVIILMFFPVVFLAIIPFTVVGIIESREERMLKIKEENDLKIKLDKLSENWPPSALDLTKRYNLPAEEIDKVVRDSREKK